MSSAKSWWILIGFIFFGALFYSLAPVLTPFLIAFVLAYLTDPLVTKLVGIKIPRTFAVAIVFILLLFMVILLIILFVPILEKQILILIHKIPQLLAWIQQEALPFLEKHFGIKEVFNTDDVRSLITKNLSQAGNLASSLWKTAFYSGYTIFMFLFNLVMIPVVMFYLLRDWESIVDGIYQLFPRSIEPVLTRLLGECDEVLGAFFRGQFLVMLSLGIYYILGLWFVGVEVAVLIGFIIGIISIVPYLGFIVGILLAVVVTFVQYHDWLHIAYVLLVFLIGSGLENAVLAPVLVGDRIGLHPVAVIFAILAGGQLLGFTGVLIALPAAAVIMVLVRFAKKRYLVSQVYTRVGPVE